MPCSCPSHCLSKTEGLARRSSALFVSPRVQSRAISKNALFFLQDVIIGAGAADLVAESSVRAHGIRGWLLLLPFLRNWLVSKVLGLQLGCPTQSSLLVILRMCLTCLRTLGPWVPSWRLGQCCLLDRFPVVSFFIFCWCWFLSFAFINLFFAPWV